jgi:uncharacterized protein (DUF302 family)
MSPGIRRVLDIPVADALTRVRETLGEQGFGVLTEIDIQQTLRTKLGVEVPPQVILGACNPALAHRALSADASVGLLLPCNVVVRQDDDGRTVVEAVDPAALAPAMNSAGLSTVADDARALLAAAVDAL